MVVVRIITIFFALLLLSAAPLKAVASSILMVVSPRNAPDVLSGAHQFLDANKSHQVQLRTTDQILDLDEQAQRALIDEADLVFMGGVYGESAVVLGKLFTEESLDSDLSLLAVHSDRVLVNLSQIGGKALLDGADLDAMMKDPPAEAAADIQSWLRVQSSKFSEYRAWYQAKAYWADRETVNMDALLRHLSSLLGQTLEVPEPIMRSPLRAMVDGQLMEISELDLSTARKHIAIIDYETGGRPGEKDLINQLCQKIERQSELACFALLAKWGDASVSATQFLNQHKDKLSAIISLQNFVLGGGEGRATAHQQLLAMNLPVLKGIRLTDSTAVEYTVSEEGLVSDSVHYRVAMPEIQGISQPLVLAAMGESHIDERTGVKLALSTPILAQVDLVAARATRWHQLQTKSNQDKRIGIIYYNHPPGRHNIGADNLNVPNSLFEILQSLKAQGYNTGELPESPEALLDLLQERGVNLPENRAELAAMSSKVQTVSAAQYRTWFEQLPALIQGEMVNGPLGYLQETLKQAAQLEDSEHAKRLVNRVIVDLKHAMEGTEHKSRDRVMDLLKQLKEIYSTANVDKDFDWKAAQELVNAIAKSGIEGIRGWGNPPGKIMVHNGQVLLPGLTFGNVFVGPQPPRGWELNEEVLHANLSFPPPHQYLALYKWLRKDFKADALVHLGRHSTYEFLPRHRVGMNEVDYPTALIGDLPSVYPYIVDGVGEGIQAKRRGLAVMVDHLTPPLESTELYDKLLELRQLVESYEAAPEAASVMRARSIQAIKKLVDELELVDELMESMRDELEVRGINAYDQLDDEFLVHEVGHYLTKMQEDFMPLGLHSFGKPWSKDAINTMADSIAKGEEAATEDDKQRWRTELANSPRAEMDGLLNGLNGGYIAPAKGNDPIRTPEVLPTGRNFYALDGGLIPSRLGYEVGVELAEQARQKTSSEKADAVVLWASDVVRDEGAMIAFGFDMLGVKPIWSSRGIVKRLERLDIKTMREAEPNRVRRDMVFTTSGLFRDLYGAHIVWLEQAVLMALDASSDTIKSDYPALSLALNQALKPLGEKQQGGTDSLQANKVAAQWVADARAALQAGRTPAEAGQFATFRVFGDAPGTYGAGVNRLVERSGAWQERSEIADVYIRRIGHAYGANLHGEPVQEVFTQRLNEVGSTYLGRSSNLYGLLDNNDTFDYLGGLSLAVETVSGEAPQSFILAHENNAKLSVEPLGAILLSELRGRFLNPQWLQPLMQEGYAGARTMGSEFIEYLWGWQVTNPDIVKSWVWDEVKAVYIDDKHELGLDDFLEQNHNVHVKSNMLAVMLVAAQKEFWQADTQTLQALSSNFADLIIENGLPGSGHTSVDHPVFEYIKPNLTEAQQAGLIAVLDAAKIDTNSANAVSTISELTPASDTQANSSSETSESSNELNQQSPQILWAVLALLFILISVGVIVGLHAPRPKT